MIHLSSLFLVLLGTILGSIGAIVTKKATVKDSWRELWLDPLMWSAILLYGVSTIFYIIALRQEELSIVYPLVSLSYVWTTLFSVKFLHEKMNKYKGIALIGILLGVILIGLGS